MKLVAIDPGKCMGYAIFENGVLIKAGVLNDFVFSLVCFQTLRKIFRRARVFVVERPRIYQGVKQKGDPNDLLLLTLQEGFIRATAILEGVKEVKTTSPRGWKGQVPKEIHNKRILSKLTLTEADVLPSLPKTKMHNCIDAIGIGLWYLQRS